MGDRRRLRWHRLVRGETCYVCGRRRRIRWYQQTRCCTKACAVSGLRDRERLDRG